MPHLSSAWPQPFYLTTATGQRFCLLHLAQGTAACGLVVYVHPFAEEMNKSRRMAAMQAKALSAAGYTVLQMDLLGCGDSSGDFGDATWQTWIDDVVHACQWLRSRHGTDQVTPLWLWGLRAGCLLAIEAAVQLDESCNFLFWAPAGNGKLLAQQFLRLKVAGDLLGGSTKGVMEKMRKQLADGAMVDVAGYALSLLLISGLEQSTLLAPARAKRLEWFELSTRDDAPRSPASANLLAQWRQAGISVRNHAVVGPPFWQTSEIEEAPALILATTAALKEVTLA